MSREHERAFVKGDKSLAVVIKSLFHDRFE